MLINSCVLLWSDCYLPCACTYTFPYSSVRRLKRESFLGRDKEPLLLGHAFPAWQKCLIGFFLIFSFFFFLAQFGFDSLIDVLTLAERMRIFHGEGDGYPHG